MVDTIGHSLGDMMGDMDLKRSNMGVRNTPLGGMVTYFLTWTTHLLKYCVTYEPVRAFTMIWRPAWPYFGVLQNSQNEQKFHMMHMVS